METMDNTMDGQALLLEQCRLDMDKLAENGDNALREAVSQAQRQANACRLDWEQSRKTVELTAQQKKSLEQTRALGEDKLAHAQREEEDARVAAETVQSIISDTTCIQDASYLDAANIFVRAGNALEETARRAQLSYAEKRAHTEEVLASLRRLAVAEKSVDYTMAKAERNASEKNLVKLIAAHRYHVYAAEYEAIKCRKQTGELQSRMNAEEQVLQDMDELLTASRQLVADKNEELKLAQTAQARDINSVQSEMESSLKRLTEQLSLQISRRDMAASQVQDLMQEVELRQKAGTEAMTQAALVAKTSSESIASAHSRQQQALQEIENELAKLRQEADNYRLAYEQALSAQDNCFQLADKAKEREQKCEERAQIARNEEAAAAKAADTAQRLAENATRVRGSISSESSNLLQQAQEVMQEAALSAKLLMDEKRARLDEAEAAYQQALSQSDAAAEAAEAATAQVEETHTACLRFEEKMISRLERSEALKREWEDRTAATITDAEKTSADAEAEAEAQHQLAQETKSALIQAQSELTSVLKELERLEEEKRNLEESGTSHLQKVRSQAAAELSRLQEEKDKADATVAHQEDNRAVQQKSINKLFDALEEARDRERDAVAKVEELITVGALEIVSAGEEVGGFRFREESARQARMAAETEAVRQNMMPSEQDGLRSFNARGSLEYRATEQEILAELRALEARSLTAQPKLPLAPIEESSTEQTDVPQATTNEVTEEDGPELMDIVAAVVEAESAAASAEDVKAEDDLATETPTDVPQADGNMSGFLFQSTNHSVVRDFVRSIALAEETPAADEPAPPIEAAALTVEAPAVEETPASQPKEWPSFGSIFNVDAADQAASSPDEASAAEMSAEAEPAPVVDAVAIAVAAMPSSLGAAFKEWMQNLSQDMPGETEAALADTAAVEIPAVETVAAAAEKKNVSEAEKAEPFDPVLSSHRTDSEGNYNLEITAPFSPEEDELRLLVLNSVYDKKSAEPAEKPAAESAAPTGAKHSAKKKFFSFFS